MNTTPTNPCPQCGQPIVPGVKGLCPHCLAMIGFGADPASLAPNGTVVIDASSQPAKPLISPTARYFGDYELLEEIARGGMGVVFKARQKSLNRMVAVKMILGGQLATEADVKRFRTEAEAAANLQHPNIVAIHEVGEHEGRHYFSMDLVDGPTLAELVKDGPLPAGRAVAYIKTIAEAVQFAHQRGILHRDLKPSNVLVDTEDRVRVTDFGLAKMMNTVSDLTHSGDVMGSPAYMAPEQARGRQDRVGPHSDVYSIGAILYELLTGQAPFRGETPVETLRKVLEEEPTPPSRLNPRTNRDLETICLKCLEKEPSRRYATARELADDLARFLNLEPILARRANPVRRVWSWFLRHPWLVTGAASLVVLLTVGFAYRMWERVDALEWRHAHPRGTPPFNSDYFLPFWFNVLLFLEFFFLQGVPVSSFLSLRARQQRRNRFYYSFAVVGAVQLLFGLEILRRAVAAQAWEPQTILSPLLVSLAALTNVWFGSALVWKALREARMDLPGVAASEEPIEHPLRFTNPKAIGNAIALELFGGIALCIVVVIVAGGEADAAMGSFFGIFGMCGMTGLVLIGQSIADSKGLERQARLPLLLVVVALVAVGLGGFGSPTWHVTPGYHILGFLVGKLLLKRCRLQRVGAGLEAERLGVVSRTVQSCKRLWRLIWRKHTVYAAAAGVALLALFYLVENWRGLRAWNQAKARLEARGEKADWADFVPKARVPDDQNVFKHPFVQEYGVRQGWLGKTKELHWFDHGFIGHGLEVGPPVPLATLKKLPTQREEPATFVSLNPRLAHTETGSFEFSGAALTSAVATLARLAGINVLVESNSAPFVTRKAPFWDAATQRWGPSTNTPTEVSFKMTNDTPAAALAALLKEHHLQPELDVPSGSYRLKPIYTSLPELLERLTRDDAQLRQLEEALQRPQAQLDWTRETSLKELPALNFVFVRKAAQGLGTRSKIHLLQGHPDDALRDLRLIKRIADFAASDPSIVGAMMKVAFEGLCVHTLEEGMGDGLWPASHLAAVQEEFTPVDLLTPWTTAMQHERAFANEDIRRLATPWDHSRRDFLDFIRMHKLSDALNKPDEPKPNLAEQLLATTMLVSPRGWFYQNMAHATWGFELILAIDFRRQTVSSETARSHLDAFVASIGLGLAPYKFIIGRATPIPNYTKALNTTAKNQTFANEAFVACALERHHAAKGAYPDKLDALVPEFAAKLPHDILDGQPLRYRLTADRKYLLYSIGWNSKDDGGTMDQPKESNSKARWSDEKGDWVWQGVPAE